eukprot:GHVH01008651.1.p1 GENE.GHVH01008651.1~~GHVH01008651.1.p1  ORF type:complete len:162 (+),score=29.59 GHVH01008651.1:55-486(+)
MDANDVIRGSLVETDEATKIIEQFLKQSNEVDDESKIKVRQLLKEHQSALRISLATSEKRNALRNKTVRSALKKNQYLTVKGPKRSEREREKPVKKTPEALLKRKSRRRVEVDPFTENEKLQMVDQLISLKKEVLELIESNNL